MEIIGLNSCLKEIYSDVQKLAPYNVNILITGETGTGKESMAQLVHDLSPRKRKTFVKVNCAAIPAELFESELFGYEKGAFTGATRAKLGLIEKANHGTLFLDEIGELPLALQAKLLRVLNDKKLYRIGSTSETEVDFRLICATNQDLPAAINQKKFRMDLYYRISNFIIKLPPLRERRASFKELSHYLLSKLQTQLGLPLMELEDTAITFLQCYSWPGNIRQLEQILLRAAIRCQGGASISIPVLHQLIEAEKHSTRIHFLKQEQTNYEYADNFDSAVLQISKSIIVNKTPLKEIEQKIILSLLEMCGRNVQNTAQVSNLSVNKIYRAIRTFSNKPDRQTANRETRLLQIVK